MRSRASLQIFVGEGSVAPGREQRICQTARISASMISGGRMRAATALSRGPSLLAKLAFGSESRSTVPARRRGRGAGIAAVASDLSRGMFMRLLRRVEAGRCARPARFTLRRA